MLKKTKQQTRKIVTITVNQCPVIVIGVLCVILFS